MPTHRLLALLVATASLTACLSAPFTPVRRAALTPSPTRPMVTAPMDRVAEVGGSISMGGPFTGISASEGDSALWVPKLQLEAHARFAAGPVALGLSTNVAWFDVASPSTLDIPPMDGAVVWGIGTDISVSHRFDSWFGLAGALSIHAHGVPWSTWALDSTTTPHSYDLAAEGTEIVPIYRLALALHFYLGDILVQVGPAVGNFVSNDGFSAGNLSRSTIRVDRHAFTPFAGLRYTHPGSGFFVQADIMFPFGLGDAHIIPAAASVTLGGAFGER